MCVLVPIIGSLCYLLNLVPESRKVELDLIKSLSLVKTHLQVALKIILNLRTHNLLTASNLPQSNTIRISRQICHHKVNNARLDLPIVVHRRCARLKITRCQHLLLQNFEVFLYYGSGLLCGCLWHVSRSRLMIFTMKVIALKDLLLTNFSIVCLFRYLLLWYPHLELLIIPEAIVLLRLLNSLKNRL